MAWSIAAAAPGTSCRIGASPELPVVAYRINDDGETHVLIAYLDGEPGWVPLDELDVLVRPKPPN
jgi:hypothetical protein